MLQLINVEQGSQEWLDLRNEYIRTASRTATVMGVSPFSNREKLAQEIKFGIKPFYSKAMKDGNDLEDKVRELANEQLDEIFYPQVGVNGKLLASLDGINLAGDTIIEIKVSAKTYNDIEKGELPEYYMWQIRHQMQVFEDVKTAYLVAYNKETDELIISEPIHREDYLEEINTAWDEFEAFMQEYELPETEVIEDVTAINEATRLTELLVKEKELKKEIDKAKNDLKTFATAKTTQIGNLTISKISRKGSIDYKKYLTEQGIKDKELEAYRKNSTESFMFKSA